MCFMSISCAHQAYLRVSRLLEMVHDTLMRDKYIMNYLCFNQQGGMVCILYRKGYGSYYKVWQKAYLHGISNKITLLCTMRSQGKPTWCTYQHTSLFLFLMALLILSPDIVIPLWSYLPAALPPVRPSPWQCHHSCLKTGRASFSA